MKKNRFLYVGAAIVLAVLAMVLVLAGCKQPVCVSTQGVGHMSGPLDITGAGTAAAPALYVAGDSDTGIWHSAANNFDIACAGVNILNVSAAGADWGGSAFDVDVTGAASIDADAASNFNVTGAGVDLTLESEAGSLVLKGDEAVATAITLDANETVTTGITVLVGSVSGFSVDGGLADFGTGTYATADGDNDVGVQGDLEVNGVANIAVGTEHIGIPSIITTAITYTAAAGGSGTVTTITDGEIWFVHGVFINVTTNFDCTGDDATLIIGDGSDTDGFIVAADAQLQVTFTEATGYAAGWYGIENGSNGAYTVDDGGPFVYAPDGSDETIDWMVDESAGETLTAGAATIYVVYTRIQ